MAELPLGAKPTVLSDDHTKRTIHHFSSQRHKLAEMFKSMSKAYSLYPTVLLFCAFSRMLAFTPVLLYLAVHPLRGGDSSALAMRGHEQGRSWKPDHSSSALTIILPAYNEALRIGDTISTYRNYLVNSSLWGTNENECGILVVDDGSTDNTVNVVRQLARSVAHEKIAEHVFVRCISLPHNEGKGAAISRGIVEVSNQNPQDMLSGCVILVADADGSGDIGCLDSMMDRLAALISTSDAEKISTQSELWENLAIVAGDRGYDGTSILRSILRWGFRTSVKVISGNLRVQDTQCGFKLMTAATGLKIYPHLHLKRWTHDVEVFFLAKQFKIPVADQIIRWEDKEGSKLVTSAGGTIGVSLLMLLEVLQMRINYGTGLWDVETGNFR